MTVCWNIFFSTLLASIFYYDTHCHSNIIVCFHGNSYQIIVNSPDGAAWSWRTNAVPSGEMLTFLLNVTPSNPLPHPLSPPPLGIISSSRIWLLSNINSDTAILLAVCHMVTLLLLTSFTRQKIGVKHTTDTRRYRQHTQSVSTQNIQSQEYTNNYF